MSEILPDGAGFPKSLKRDFFEIWDLKDFYG
jgi:hypothetical protein